METQISAHRSRTAPRALLVTPERRRDTEVTEELNSSFSETISNIYSEISIGSFGLHRPPEGAGEDAKREHKFTSVDFQYSC